MNPKTPSVTPAGFVARYCAYTLDLTLLSIPLYMLMSLMDQSAISECKSVTDPCMQAAIAAMVKQAAVSTMLYLVLAAMYFPLMEHGPMQGTLGKHLVGIYVTDMSEKRISLPQALLRHVASLLNWVTLGLLPVMIMMRDDRRGAHDLVAKTQVLAEARTWKTRSWVGVAILLHLALIGAMTWTMANSLATQMEAITVQGVSND